MGYIEDSYLQGGMIRECQSNVTDTCCIFRRLGFAIHYIKSVLGPVESLGFSSPGFSYFWQYNCVPSPLEVCLASKASALGLLAMSISVQKQTPFRITMVVPYY